MKGLKKSNSSRQVGGVEIWKGAERLDDKIWHGEVAAVVEQGVPHSCVVDNNQEGYLRSEKSQPQARPNSPSFQLWEDKSP